MSIGKWKKQICTIPNLLSLLRLFLIPVYVTIYLNADSPREYFLAGSILAFSCLTDAVDGYIARKYHMVSTLGKILDPLADKLTQITLTICLSVRYPVLLPVMILLFIKESLQIVGAVLLLRRGSPFPSAIFAGKISTVVLFVSLTALVLFPYTNPKIVTGVAILDCISLLYAFVSYYTTFFGDSGKANRTHI